MMQMMARSSQRAGITFLSTPSLCEWLQLLIRRACTVLLLMEQAAAMMVGAPARQWCASTHPSLRARNVSNQPHGHGVTFRTPTVFCPTLQVSRFSSAFFFLLPEHGHPSCRSEHGHLSCPTLQVRTSLCSCFASASSIVQKRSNAVARPMRPDLYLEELLACIPLLIFDLSNFHRECGFVFYT